MNVCVKFPALRRTVILLCSLLVACASLLGTQEREIPLIVLQQSLQKKFPFNHRYLELFDMTVSNPVLSLQPDTNRVATTLDARIAPPLLKKSWEGKVVISGALKIDPARSAIVLTEPRVDNLTIDAATGTYTGKLNQLGMLLAEDLLDNTVIYTFKPEEIKVAGVRFRPAKITTRANGLVVSFEPAK